MSRGNLTSSSGANIFSSLSGILGGNKGAPAKEEPQANPGRTSQSGNPQPQNNNYYSPDGRSSSNGASPAMTTTTMSGNYNNMNNNNTMMRKPGPTMLTSSPSSGGITPQAAINAFIGPPVVSAIPENCVETGRNKAWITVNVWVAQLTILYRTKLTRLSTISDLVFSILRRLAPFLSRRTSEHALTYEDSLQYQLSLVLAGDSTALITATSSAAAGITSMPLNRERTLFSYGVQDDDVLELTPKPFVPIMIRVKIPMSNSAVALRVDAETDVWSVLLKLTKKFQKQSTENDPIEKWGLYLEEIAGEKYTLLDDTLSMSSYPNLTNQTKILFRSKGMGKANSNEETIHLKVRFDNESGFGETTLSQAFPLNISLQDIIKRVVKLTHLPDYHSYCVCLPAHPSFIYLKDDATLGSLKLNSYDTIYIKERCRNYVVELWDKSEEKIAVNDTHTIGDITTYFRSNYPHLDELDQYGLFYADGATLLDQNRTIWKLMEEYVRTNKAPAEDISSSAAASGALQSTTVYSGKLVFKKRLQKLNVIFRERNEDFEIDYSQPFRANDDEILNAIFVRFQLLKFLQDPMYSKLVKVPEMIVVDFTRGLKQQKIDYGSSLHLAVKLPPLPDLYSPTQSIILANPTTAPASPLPSAQETPQAPNVNVWDEIDSAATIVTVDPLDKNSDIEAATLNKLVSRLASETLDDLSYLKAFFMTFRTFTTPKMLLAKLVERYSVPQIVQKVVNVRTVQLRVGNAIRLWLEKAFYPDQDLDLDLIYYMFHFAETLSKDGNILGDKIRSLIFSRVYPSTASSVFILGEKKQFSRLPMRASPLMKTTDDFYETEEMDLASQITLFEFQFYSDIQAPELLGQCWAKPKTQHKCPHVMNMIGRFNTFGQWIAQTIIEPVSLRVRVNRMERAVNIAKCLRTLNNFSSLMAIIGGLNNAAVQRLKWTRSSMSKKHQDTLAELERVMKSEGSFKLYRDALNCASPPAIPCLGVHLQDLTFMEDGNPDFIKNDLINFSKRRLLYGAVDRLLLYQDRNYSNLLPSASILAFLDAIPVPDSAPEKDKALFETSLTREPRGVENKADLVQ